MEKFILKFSEIGMHDVPQVGGKNASLGEMFNSLKDKGIKVPDGFATTSKAFHDFIAHNQIREPLNNLIEALDKKTFSNLRETGQQARDMIMSADIPGPLKDEIVKAYKELSKNNESFAVAVRSSATAEDLPEASFAGQHESYLNIRGTAAVVDAVHRCFASLYTDRAIKYRFDHGFDHATIALSAGVQHMVRADKACSGVGFTLEPESGFRDIIHLSGVWGLGENIVQGTVTPDEFYLFKPLLDKVKLPIIQKRMGEKGLMMVYPQDEGIHRSISTINIRTPESLQKKFVLTDEEVIQLGKWAEMIEQHYGMPMDIEWAKDGISNELFIVQARPETVHSQKDSRHFSEYRLLDKAIPIVTGAAVGEKIATGIARILRSPAEAHKVNPGDIVVTELTSPDWDPILKTASAIITDRGGRTSHASIIARELGVPAVIGTYNGTSVLKEGQQITVSCAEGKNGMVYDGYLRWEKTDHDFSTVVMPQTKALMILGDPSRAFRLSFYPNEGVGLMRIEFIINHAIQIHPMALAHFDEVKDPKVRNLIEEKTQHAASKEQFFVDNLAQGVGTIAAAFYPKEVIVRMSDFKTNEYANLIGGKQFEAEEANPMLGFRGASRYYHPHYQDGFRLECAAMKQVREEMGLTNVKLMIPFCRTVEEGEKVIEVMKGYGLQQGVDGLEIYVMAEIPSNVIQAEDFAEVFDGFSIGSNDLTQLTLGIDRDSTILADLFSENNKSVKRMIAMAIEKARAAGKPIGLCGQAPSDMPEFARFLIEQGISTISFNPDALIKGIENMVAAERMLQSEKV